jgi:hypothetical protein
MHSQNIGQKWWQKYVGAISITELQIYTYLSLIKQQFVVAHKICQTEIPALLDISL